MPQWWDSLITSRNGIVSYGGGLVKFTVKVISGFFQVLHHLTSSKVSAVTVTFCLRFHLWLSFLNALKTFSLPRKSILLGVTRWDSLSMEKEDLSLWTTISPGAITSKIGHLAKAQLIRKYGCYFLKRRGLRFLEVTCESKEEPRVKLFLRLLVHLQLLLFIQISKTKRHSGLSFLRQIKWTTWMPLQSHQEKVTKQLLKFRRQV